MRWCKPGLVLTFKSDQEIQEEIEEDNAMPLPGGLIPCR